MSASKLVVQRYENDNDFQTLHIVIGQNDDSSGTIYGIWRDGKDDVKKKDKDKSRLVVKIVTEENTSDLNLDFCSHKINNVGQCVFDTPKNITMVIGNDVREGLKKKSNIFTELTPLPYKYPMSENKNIQNTKPDSFTLGSEETDVISPLEYSLEKVKENNARIMENIHMLNRALNYTKKKEISDTINPKSMRSYPCDECGKCFVYETGLRRHYSVRHISTDSQPRWQFVWTCTECFQVWPRQDIAYKHANKCCKTENNDCVREIKTSSLLQCEFCEKVFTSIPRILRHSKMHTVTNNYECNACDIAFSCYKTAEQHWLICPWLKMCYQFSLPKMLLCNACDRKFRNYNQLYNHRYKSSHFIPKISEESDCTLPTLVYQCEICGQWFNTTIQLETHRNQCHPHYDNGIISLYCKYLT
ncbi:zinc finger protein 415-like isoform X1 [Danaus plexippus]|uniref:zinc finger protein 415-like isoform X1 n=2 Tax=Danaus plexippus TaxID=13037 RepID=UPI002AB0E729|nr:zinc finger protein 415-like isoform X1 [Danaus plexippus]